MNFIEYLKNDPLVCIRELEELKQKAKSAYEHSSLDSNDLRRSVFGQIYQILNVFLGGFCLVVSDSAREGFEVRSCGKARCKIKAFNMHDLENMFASYFIHMSSSLIECIENFLKVIFRQAFSTKAASYGKGFIKFPDLLKEFFALDLITVQQKGILLNWMQLLRNPRHSNYVDNSGAPLYLTMESWEQPFSVKEQIDVLIKVITQIASHPDIQTHGRLVDVARENDGLRLIKWHIFCMVDGKI